MSPKTKGILLVLAAAILWSAGGIGVKAIPLSPLAVAGFRASFALPIMLLDVFGRARRNRAQLPPLLLRPRLLGAAVSYAVMVTTFVLAAKLGSPSSAVFIQYTGPLYVGLLAGPLLGEKLRLSSFFALGGCFTGLLLFFGGELSHHEFLGHLFAVFSSFGFAGLPLFLLAEDQQLILEQKSGGSQGIEARAAADVAPVLAMTLGNALTVFFALPSMWSSHASLQDLLPLALLGTFQIGVPYILYGLAVRHLRALESSLLAMLEPILTPLWMFLFRGEIPGKRMIWGGTLLLGSVFLEALFSKKETKEGEL